MFTKFYRTVRRWYRRYKYTTRPEAIVYYGSDGKPRVGYPVRASGMGLIIDIKLDGARHISIAECQSRKEFIRAWYSLGGGNTYIEGGVPLDPDDM